MSGGQGTPVIHLLDPSTVNQIAAGEVVERPSSVVKELVENAIDAGAGSVRIDLFASEGKISSIRIIDDGCGMSPQDAALAFIPHATSKISGIEDLDTIRTLGFRGEALASIAAVARVTLTTKPRDSGIVAGTKIVIAGGVVEEHGEVGAPEGTTILVEDIFFNTPARKKFLKSINTELAQIHTIMEGICFSHPQISFRLFYNSHEQMMTDRSPRPLDTIARLYGAETVKHLFPVEAEFPFMTISGYISQPSLSRKDMARMLVVINGRFISSSVINGAVRNGYGTLLAKDRSPVAFLSLRIDTGLVDVNVHPTKKLVRLSREKEIAAAIRKTVSDALLRQDLIPVAETSSQSTVSLPAANENPAIYSYPVPRDPVAGGVSESTHFGTIDSDQRLRQTELQTGIPVIPSKLPAIEVIGEFGGIYILGSTDTNELVIIDQHAAHERILYEQILLRLNGEHHSQELIWPVILHRTPKEASILKDLLPALSGEGFILEEFGKDTFIVRAIPVVLGRMEDAGIIDEIISDLLNDATTGSANNRERITRVIACRGAIKAGTVCTREQCQRIIHQLRLTNNPFTCPHGRPTIIRFSRADLDTMFKRT
ncbi:MAG: DNA mismatch repair endonuclease MutL [Methanoregula sp.]|nr:DNA mismatch repair endonuclease MutL [Methanoregula sp.]